MSKKQNTGLSDAQIRAAADIGIKAYREEKRKEDKKREKSEDPIEITRNLLRNYRTLKASARDELFTEDEIEQYRFEFFKDLMESHGSTEEITEIRIKAKQRRKAMDLFQLAEIDEAFKKYESDCENKEPEDARRARVLFKMYLDDTEWKVEDVAENENISERTVYNDANKATQIFSIYLLGSLILPKLLSK